MWTFNQAIEVARELEPLAIRCGYHTAIGGGVVQRGWSAKDLDIFFYISKTEIGCDTNKLIELLKCIGFTEWIPRSDSIAEEDQDRKVVFACARQGKRIDLFILHNSDDFPMLDYSQATNTDNEER